MYGSFLTLILFRECALQQGLDTFGIELFNIKIMTKSVYKPIIVILRKEITVTF